MAVHQFLPPLFYFFVIVMAATAVLLLIVSQFYRGKIYIPEPAAQPTRPILNEKPR